MGLGLWKSDLMIYHKFISQNVILPNLNFQPRQLCILEVNGFSLTEARSSAPNIRLYNAYMRSDERLRNTSLTATDILLVRSS